MNDWILASERMPEEHPTIFAKLKGTDKWNRNMSENMSDKVIATVLYSDGERRTEAAHTADGVWKTEYKIWNPIVIAWMPFPDPFKGEKWL
jgi:hypothetical protein